MEKPSDSGNLKRRLWWVVYAGWLALIIVLFTTILDRPQGGLRAPDELLSGVDLVAESSWMGIYIKGQKVGYIHTELNPIPKSSGYEIREFSRISGAMMGAMQQMRMRMSVKTDSTLALVSFTGRIESDPYATSFAGRVEENVLAIEITTAGRKSDKFIPAPEPIYLSQAIKPLLQAGRLHEGDSLKLAGFDPVSLEMQNLFVQGASLEIHRLWGEDILARKLITRLSGFESTVYVDNDGNTLAEFGPLSMIMRREDMETALQIDDQHGGVDFLAIYAIKPNGKIRAPRKSYICRYRISGFDINEAADASDRQEIIDPDEGIIEVNSLDYEGDLSVGDYERFTQDAPFIESRDKSIRRAAKNAVMGAKTSSDSIDQLTTWVFKAVNKKPTAALPSALAVLRVLEGDCNEHSVLFTALARALGIPARIQLGVVYQAGSFFYHAWPAVWIDDRWLEVDPTFGQTRADAARIALASGDLSDSFRLVSAIGEIQIEILDSQ